MKKIVSFLLIVLLSFCLVGCGEENFTTPGYNVLYGYLSPRAPDEQLTFENTGYKYYHDYVAIEARENMLCVFVALPVANSNLHETISLRLKNNEKRAVVSIAFPYYYGKESLYGYIDLTTYSVESDVIWGLETRELGEMYGKYLSDGLLFIEYYIQNQFEVSLYDLGFINF